MANLKDQTAVVTGGSSGIGLAIAECLLAEGMAVCIAARDPQRLEKARRQLARDGRRVLAIATDVSLSDQVQHLMDEAHRDFGRIDLLVNNAGIGQLSPVTDCSETEWDEIQATNLKGAFLCTRAVLPIMKQQQSGYIVNIASLAGKSGFAGASAYSASKFGMVGLTESVLEEIVGDHIRATVICPGYVDTPMVEGVSVPPEEMIPPRDIGQLVVTLLHLSPTTIIREIVVQRSGGIC